MSFTCLGCGAKLRSFGAVGNHGKYAKNCTPEMRFWGKIKKTDSCWLWQGCVNTTGYGMANWAGRKNIVAHRLVWTLLKGEIPAGLEACHTCDTPRCCNPDHIFLASHAENMADCKAKGRQSRGERSKRNKLTEAQVLEIRANPPRLGRGLREIDVFAAKYGVNKGTIYCAMTGRTWSHIK